MDFNRKELPGATAKDRDDLQPKHARRRYRPPQLVEFGDVRDMVLGITPGIGDSGNPTLFRP